MSECHQSISAQIVPVVAHLLQSPMSLVVDYLTFCRRELIQTAHRLCPSLSRRAVQF